MEHILRGKEAASGFTKGSVPEDVAPLGEGGSSMEDVSHPPPLPDPPRVIPGAPSSKVDVPAPSDPEVENLLSSLAAAEAKIANSRAALAASAAALDIESSKAIAAEATYHAHHVKKQEEKERKRALMSDLSKRLAEAQGLDAELKSQNDAALAAADSAR